MTLALPTPVLWTLAGVYALLGIATAIALSLANIHQDQDHRELKARIQSWWIIVTVFSGALLLNRTISILFFAILSFLALREYLSLIPTRLSDRRVILWAYLAIGLQYFWVHIGWYGMFLIFIPVYMFLFLPMRMVLIGETTGFLNAIGTINWGLMLTVYALSHLSYLLMVPTATNPSAGGTGLLVYLVLLTEINDIAQYCWGKLLGRHKVVPKVSPGKTVEGLLGGMTVTTGIAVVLAPWLTPFSPLHALCLGLLLSLMGFIGDVTVSALKRDLKLKDSGTLLPGHGGILDRIDSLTYTAPLFFHFTVYFYVGGQWL
ncbi:phosphatidate cytidylyltransferase [Oscillatoria sp. CS-180]|uniref:phosphatidate cytidylyltransferase n=1 Tax=Oscillatoria sp. CS-180 TaxID=3021720 RepID=UPI00232FB909|nr:phosphatidate cytidylyltransferase [Oscillatoria sp. CS-180]MDB9524860.1 phosphatidate cytidylyltransferase [Oscillatoria sp. CS-180]